MKQFSLLFALCAFFACSTVQAQGNEDYWLWMRINAPHTLWDGSQTTIYGFNTNLGVPPLPSPTLYVNEGDTFTAWVKNLSQGPAHSIHWHGLDVDQENDGVPMTSFQLWHDEDTVYTWVAPHAGTYLYHCHVATIVHVQMGMYGAVIVRPADSTDRAWTNGPAYARDYLWLQSEIDKSWHDTIPDHFDPDSIHAVFAVPPYEPDYFLVSGKAQHQLQDSSIHIRGMVGEAIYLRLANVGFLANEVILPPALQAEVISSDGRPLPTALRRDTIVVMPGERYGVMLRPNAEMTATATVHFRDMNNWAIRGTEEPPVTIAGILHQEDLANGLSYQLYPNPATAWFQVELEVDRPQEGELALLALDGRELWRQELPSHRHLEVRVPTGQLPAGMYLMRLRIGERVVCHKVRVSP